MFFKSDVVCALHNFFYIHSLLCARIFWSSPSFQKPLLSHLLSKINNFDLFLSVFKES
jgi:hypothetical protein